MPYIIIAVQYMVAMVVMQDARALDCFYLPTHLATNMHMHLQIYLCSESGHMHKSYIAINYAPSS